MTPVTENRLLDQIKELLGGWPTSPETRQETPTPPASHSGIVGDARKIYRARRARETLFGADADLFGEPAWDILLDLYIAHQTANFVSISSACIAAAVPPTTGLRHLKALERRGFTERVYDPIDRRRCYVRLSPHAIELLDAWFGGLAGGSASTELETSR